MQDFFRGILRHGRLNESYIDHLLENYMADFKTSTVHRSINQKTTSSLEYFEKIGDTVVNLCIGWWFPVLHPEIINIGYMDYVLAAMKGTTYLSRVAIEHGWERVVSVREEDLQYLKDIEVYMKAHPSEYEKFSYKESEAYLELYEDALEAFFGCLVYVMLKDGKSFGTGMQVAFNIFTWLVENTHFDGPKNPPGVSLGYSDIKDPATRFRNLYQNINEGLRWGVDTATSSTKDKKYEQPGFWAKTSKGDLWIPKMYRIAVYHWDGLRCPEGVNPKNFFTTKNRKLLIESKWSPDKTILRRKYTEEALRLLREGKDAFGNKLTKTYQPRHPLKPLEDYKAWDGFYYDRYQNTIVKVSGPEGRAYEGKGHEGKGSKPTFKPQGGKGNFRKDQPPRFSGKARNQGVEDYFDV